MNKTRLFVLLISIVFVSKAALASWPPNVTAGGSYVVSPSEATSIMSDVVLPDNFTIRFDDRVTAVSWTIQKLTFGRGCTIDLSHRNRRGTDGARGSDAQGQPAYGREGSQGGRGGDGGPGRDGVAFNLTIFEYPTKGSLWIKTDGAPGGNGGDGGRGGLGGGWCCGYNCSPHTNGGKGGRGGDGGSGGKGGDTAKVLIRVGNNPGAPVYPVGCEVPRLIAGPNYWVGAHSVRPTNASGDDGTIVIWGASGTGGMGGNGGGNGSGGDGPPSHRKDCGMLSHDVYGGDNGSLGNYGGFGPAGSCTK